MAGPEKWSWSYRVSPGVRLGQSQVSFRKCRGCGGREKNSLLLCRRESLSKVVISVPFSGVSALSYFLFKYIQPSTIPSSAIQNTYITASSRAWEMKHSWSKISHKVTDTQPIPACEPSLGVHFGSRVGLELSPSNLATRTAAAVKMEVPFLNYSERKLPYNSKSVMGERMAPHLTGESSPLTSRLVT